MSTAHASLNYEPFADQVTPAEAEAILALWARRQQEADRSPNASVQDIAEALSLPADQVRRMLMDVRSAAAEAVAIPAATVPQRKGMGKRRVRVLIGLVAIVVLFPFIMDMVARRGLGRFSAQPYLVSSRFSPGYESKPPVGYTVSFDNYKRIGDAEVYAKSEIEPRLMSSMESIVSEVGEPFNAVRQPHTRTAGVDVDYHAIALRLARNQEIGEAWGYYKTLKASINGRSESAQLPFPVVNDPMLEEMLRQERTRRIKILANQIANPVLK